MRSQYLGKKATDIITGFTGTVTGFVEYLTGCDQCLVIPKAKSESEYPAGSWLDVNRLEFSEHPAISLDTSQTQGSDISPPGY